MDKEKIMVFLRNKGPSVPNDIKKALGGDTIIFGAILSELISRGQIKITKLKMGSSPFYYLPGQEQSIERLVTYLNPKDQETVRLLREQKVIRESEHSLFVRLSLRNIPDFAKEMMIQTKEGPYRFWRYYLISQEEALKIINERQQAKAQEKKPIDETKPANESDDKPKIDKKIKEPKDEINSNDEQKIPEVKNKEVKKETPEPEKQQLLNIKPSLEKTPFYELIINYFEKNKIIILHEQQLSKDREYIFKIKLPTMIGDLEFLAYARNKKKLNETDAALALLKAKNEDLQCLFLTNGDFTKKSLQIINKEYKGMIIKKL